MELIKRTPWDKEPWKKAPEKDTIKNEAVSDIISR